MKRLSFIPSLAYLCFGEHDHKSNYTVVLYETVIILERITSKFSRVSGFSIDDIMKETVSAEKILYLGLYLVAFSTTPSPMSVLSSRIIQDPFLFRRTKKFGSTRI